MPDYIVGQSKYTEAEAIAAAEEQNLDLASWKARYKAISVPGNQSDPVNVETNTGSETNTVSSSEDTSLESQSYDPKNDDILESDLKNYPGDKQPEFISEILASNVDNPTGMSVSGIESTARLNNAIANTSKDELIDISVPGFLPQDPGKTISYNKLELLEIALQKDTYNKQQNQGVNSQSYQLSGYKRVNTKMNEFDDEINREEAERQKVLDLIDRKNYEAGRSSLVVDDADQNSLDVLDSRILRIKREKDYYYNNLPKYGDKLYYDEGKAIINVMENTTDDQTGNSNFAVWSADNEEESIDIAEEVEEAIINEMLLPENDALKRKVIGRGHGYFADAETIVLEEKENIIANAKIDVLKKRNYDLTIESREIAKFYNDKYNAGTLTDEDVLEYEGKIEVIQDQYSSYRAEIGWNVGTEVFNNSFKMTEALLDYREGLDRRGPKGIAAAGDAVKTVIQGSTDFVADYFVGTALMLDRALVYGLGATGIIGEDTEDKMNESLDFLGDVLDRYVKVDYTNTSDLGGNLTTGKFNLFDGSTWEANLTARSISKTVANMIPFTLAVAASFRKGKVKQLKDAYKIFSEGGKKGLKFGNIGVTVPKIKLPNALGGKTILEGGKKTIGNISMNTVYMGQTAYFGTLKGNYDEGIASGLSIGQSIAYSNMASFATAIVQSIMPDVNFFNTKAGVNLLKGFKGELSKAGTKAARKQVTKQFLNNLGGEIGEEELELLLTDFAKMSVGLSNELGFLDSKVQFETVMGTVFLAGGTSAVTSAAGGYKNVKDQVYNEARKDVNKTIGALKANLEYYQDIFKRAEAKNMTDLADRARNSMNEAKKGLEHGMMIQKAINLGGEFVTNNEIDLYIEKQKLLDAKKTMGGKAITTISGVGTNQDGDFTSETTYDLASLNERIAEIDSEIAGGRITQETDNINKKSKENAIDMAKKLEIDTNSYSDDLDEDGNVTISADQKVQDRIDAINRSLPTRNKGKKEEEKDDEVSVKRVGDNGFIVQFKDGTQEIIINETKSEESGAVTVEMHEVLHGALNETLRKNPKAAQAMAGALKDQIDNMISMGYEPSAYLGMNLENYNDQSADVKAEEMLTFFSDGMAQGYIAFNETVFTKMGDTIRQALQNVGIKGIKFNTGKDVYNFLKDYNKAMMSEKGVRGSLLKGAKTGFKGSLVNGLGTQTRLEQKVNKAFETKAEGYGNEIVNMYNDYVHEFVGLNSGPNVFGDSNKLKMATLIQSKILQIVGNHKASDKTSLTDKIGRLFGPTGTSTKSNRSSKDLYSTVEDILGVSGMTEEQRVAHMSKMSATDKIRNGQLIGYEYTNEVNKRLRKYQNIPGFNTIKESILADITYGVTKKGKSGAEIKVQGIVDIVSRYDGSIEINRWINGQLDNKILGVVKSYELGKEATEFSTVGKKSSTIKRGKYDKLIDSRVFFKDVITSLKDNVIKIVKVLKTPMNKAVGKNVTIPPWLQEFKKEIGTQNDLIIKQAMGGLKNDRLAKFLIKNKKAILENMTTTWLSGAIPSAIQKKVNGKWTFDWKGEKINVESSEETGRTSGIEIAKRYTGLSDQQFLENFGTVVKNKNGSLSFSALTRGRKESLAKALAEETGLELIQTNEQVQNELAKNQKAQGVVLATIGILEISRQIERGNAKSNRSSEETQKMLLELMTQAISKGGSSEAYQSFKRDQPDDIRAYADEIGLDTYFDDSTKFRGPLTEWDGMPSVFKDYQEEYKVVKTNKNNEVAMEQLADFSEAFMDFLPPELVSYLNDEMFGITNRYLDGALTKKDKDGNIIPGKQGKYNYLSKKRRSKSGKNSNIKLPFTPADIEIFNSGNGLMKQIVTILKKGYDKNGQIITADQKRKIIEDKFGDRIANAEIANKAAFKYIIEQATILVAKNPKLAPGLMRWFESATGNVKAQRGLTGLPLIQYTDGSMEADETHPYYKEAKEFAIARSTEMYNRDAYSGIKARKEFTLQEFIDKRLKNPKTAPESHLKFKGEHIDPAANVMLDMAKVSLKNAAKIIQLGLLGDKKVGQLNSLTTFMGIELDKVLISYNQTLGAELFSAIQDDILGSTSKAGDFRGLAVDENTYNTFTTIEGLQAIEYIKRAKLSLDFIDKIISTVNVDQYIKNQNASGALDMAIDIKKKTKGISVFDFDDTLAQTKSNVLYTLPDGTKGKIDATQFAAQSNDLEAKDAKFDFSEFNKVVDGKKGPLADLALKRQGKFGGGDIFVLTARPQASAKAIKKFLKGIGLNIKLENITGLENGDAQAKADWVISKAADGYNDFYFADDAIKNVKAVADALEVLDVKGKVQQALVKSNKTLDLTINQMLELSSGIDANKNYSKAKAKMVGRDKGRFRFFLPPSAEDFMGLMYNFLGKGKVGETQKEWIKEKLLKPYASGIANIERAKQAVQDSYKELTRQFSDVKKLLSKQIPGEGFTYDQAIRVYLYTKSGKDVPGLSKADLKTLLSVVNGDQRLKLFADSLSLISNQKDGWTNPGEYWLTESIPSDLDNITNKVGRKKFIQEFLDNSEIIFSEKNLNKMEAIYGENFRESLEDILFRMSNGTNRTFGKNKLVNTWSNWLNNSVGAIMFFNMRSALLQTLSTVNFINWTDNNPVKAAAAFANQKQYWSDFITIFNSDKLRQRRTGLKTDVNEAELANAVAGSKNKAKAAFQYLLKIGFTPTQIADSFAISAGGATMYRNRVNTYIKEGMSKAEAEAKAWEDFSLIAEETQQSSDPSLISAQQAGPLGRFILAFQNTPMQYNRLIKKAASDLINGRGDWRANVSKIVYYGAVQNFIFTAFQKALFAMLFEDEDTRCEGKTGTKLERCQNKNWKIDTGNSMADTILRGSGLYGAIAATIKNTIRQFTRQEKKGFTADHTYTIMEMVNLSPPLGSKLRKIYNSIQTSRFEKDVMKERGLKLDSPTWSVIGNLVSGVTNVPLDRLVKKVNNIKAALDERNAIWKRAFFAFGWNTWDLDAAPNDTHVQIKTDAKARRKKEGIEKGKITRENNKRIKQEELLAMTPAQRLKLEQEAAKKRSESAKKGAATRMENKRIADSIILSEYIKKIKKNKPK